jgi:tetratricopeptide (TPR) repeat protein
MLLAGLSQKSKMFAQFPDSMPAATQTSTPRVSAPPVPPSSSPWRARPQIIIAALLVLAIVGVYAQTTKFDFVSVDDFEYVRDNYAINGGFSWEGVKWAFTHNVAGNWHPITMLAHMLDCQVYGLVPGGHHYSALLLHISNTLLLFFLLLRMTRKLANNLWPSAFVATLFALHPLHVESVAWISERKDVLSGFFFMLTLWAYVRYVEGCTQREPANRNVNSIPKLWRVGFAALKWYAVALVCFAFGLMSKPMLVTVPCVLVLLDYWPLQRINKFSLREFGLSILEKVPFFALTGLFSVITVHAQKSAKAVVSFQDWPLKSRLAAAVVAYAQYIEKTFVPRSLGVLYPHRVLSESQITGSAILLILISIAAFAFARSRRYLFVGWFLFIGVMFPVCGLFQVGEQAFADRFTYLPHIGFFIAISWLLCEAAAVRSKLPVITAVLAAACIPVTYLQVQHWANSEALFENSVHVASDNATAHHYLAVILDDQGKTNEAMVHFSRAVECNPNNVTARCGYAYALLSQNKFADAAQQYESALAVEPDNVKAHYGLADSLLKLNRLGDALNHYIEALKLQPDIAGAHYQLGTAMLSGKQNPAVAIQYLRNAVHFAPEWTDALNTLAWAEATHADGKVRDGNEAVKLATRAVSITRGNDPGLLDTLAASYAETGKFDNAIYAEQRAIRTAQASRQTNSIAEFQSHLKSFQAQKPWRE